MRHYSIYGFYPVLLLLLSPSCQRRPSAADQSPLAGSHELRRSRGFIRSVSLVDSVLLNRGPTSRSFYRVAVHHDSSVDTIPGLLASALPTLVAHTVLLGLAYDSTTDTESLFRYSVPEGRLQMLGLPPGLDPNLTDVAFAPDGNYLAFVRFPGDETGVGTVRKWPSGEIVSETPPVPVDASDVVAGEARWVDSTRFELFIDSHGYGWLRFRGTVGGPGFTVDTLGAGPSNP